MYHQNSEEIFDFQMLPGKVEKLEDQNVHLWRINRSVYLEKKNYSEYFLSEDEQNRAQRFRFRKDHDLFVMGRYITKVMLAYYTGTTPESVKIVPDSFGKPRCDINLFFNISHSGDQLFLGFSTTEIGVDIERIDSEADTEKIGERHFSEIEFQNLMSYPRNERIEVFFEIWTKKEALIKGIGKGLSIPLQGFNIYSPNGEVLWELQSENKYGKWNVQNIEAKQGFKSAIATQNKGFETKYFCHDK